MADSILTVKKMGTTDAPSYAWNTGSLTADIILRDLGATKLDNTVTNLQIALHGVSSEK